MDSASGQKTIGRNESFAYVVDVFRQHGIVDDRHLLANLGGGLLAELNVLLLGEQVEAGLKAMRPLRERWNSETKNNYDCACQQNDSLHITTFLRVLHGSGSAADEMDDLEPISIR